MGAALAVRSRPRHFKHGDEDIFQGGKSGQQEEGLEDEAKVFGAELTEVGEMRQGLATVADFSGVRRIQSSEQAE